MGKYDAIIGDLPKSTDPDPYQEKIDVLKREFRAALSSPEQMAQEYSLMRQAKDELKDELSVIQQRVTALEQMMIESQDANEEGWGRYGAKPNALRLASGAVVRIDHEPDGRVEDKEAFRQWCLANGLEKSLHLWPTTMKAITKERLLAGQSEPDGVVAYAVPKVVFTSAKGSE